MRARRTLGLDERRHLNRSEEVVQPGGHVLGSRASASGIGLGLARQFVAAGSTVIVGGRNPEPQDGLETVRIDVTGLDSIVRAMKCSMRTPTSTTS